MTKRKPIDVMDSLLSGASVDEIPEVEHLNCLIYSDGENPAGSEPQPAEGEAAWTTENEQLSVQVWESRQKIRIRVSPKPKIEVSMQRLAEVALKAIMEDLKKDKP